jgi:hypothetical protein
MWTLSERSALVILVLPVLQPEYVKSHVGNPADEKFCSMFSEWSELVQSWNISHDYIRFAALWRREEIICNKLTEKKWQNVAFIICGSINVNYLDNNRKIQDTLSSFDLFNTAHFPIRIQNNSVSAIDIFIDINRSGNYTGSPLVSGLSDHDGQIMYINNINLQTRNSCTQSVLYESIFDSIKLWNLTHQLYSA